MAGVTTTAGDTAIAGAAGIERAAESHTGAMIPGEDVAKKVRLGHG
jgi:hypothetical protein